MKRYFQKVLAIVLSCFTAVQMITPTFAQEQDISSISANSVVNVSVQGEGNVIVQESGQSHTVMEDNPLTIETMPDQTISFLIEKQEGLIISSFKENDVNVDTFEVGSEEFNYDYVTTTTETDFVITFDKKQQEESKLNTSVESENEAAKDEDVGKVENIDSVDDILDDPNLSQELKEDGIKIDFTKQDSLSNKEWKIVNDYAKGITNKYKDLRKEKAEEVGLIKYVDSDYFMNDNYYSKYDAKMLLFDGCFILDKTITKSYQDSTKVTLPSQSKISALAARETLSVTNVKQVRCPVPNSLYLQNELFTLSNGKLAFCAENREATPQAGMVSRAVYELDRADLRKIIYYGYGGPGNILGQYGEGAACITSEAFSYLLTGTSVSLLGYSYRERFDNFIRPRMNEMLSKPDPIQYGFKIYMVEFNGMGTSWMGEWRPYQKLVYGEMSYGDLQISKVSANPDITDGNSCYNLEGAQYGVYGSEADANNRVNGYGVLTIGADGWSNVLENLIAKTYYIKEIKAPQGYALDPNIYSIQVNAGTKATKELKDIPQSDPVGILLGKIDKETNANKPQGSASLANAQFTVKYYKGLYDSDPAKQGISPARTWVLKTDKDGFTLLDKSYLVSGDDFYYNGNSDPTLPVGTITIQETLAPEGYYINDEVFVRKITSEGSTESVNTYNEPKVPEQVIKFRIHKIQEDSTVAIPGAVFRHTKPDGTTEELTTDKNGNIEIVGLETGKHTLQEISVMDGYEINSTKIEFEVKSGGKLIMLTDLTGTGIEQTTESDGNTMITVSDEVSDYDFKLIKINDHDKLLDGAEFTLYEDKECTKPIDVQTTKNGQLEFKNLKDRTNYYFKETKAPQGYRIPFNPTTKAPHVYRVYVESTPAQGKFNFWIDNVMYTVNNTNKDDAVHLEGTTANRVISIEIVNYVGVQLPATGSNMTLIILGIGLAMMTGAYFFNKRKKETKGE